MPYRLQIQDAGGAALAGAPRRLPRAAHVMAAWAAKLLLAVVLLWLVSAADARAQAACTPTITNTAFGSPNLVAGTGLTTTATITINCTGLSGSNWFACPSFGQGSGGVSGTSRLMTGPAGATLLYNLYSDAARSVRWGAISDASLGTVPRIAIPRTGSTGTSGAITIYGGIATGQGSNQPGAYSSSFAGQVSIKLMQGAATTCTGSPAVSTNNSGTFTVSASPVAACTLTAANLSFGTRGVIDANVDATSSVSVTCATGLAYTVQMSNGLTGTGPTARRLTNGGVFLTYGLYRDTLRTLAWGGVGETNGGTGNGAAQGYTVYGRVPAQTTPTPGAYSDTVVATITY